jgi:paraquat-inducible protein B
MDGHDNWTKLNTFRAKVRELGREITIKVKQNPVDENGKDFFVDNLRLGSLPKDQFALFADIQVGDVFDAIITQKGKCVYLHTLTS